MDLLATTNPPNGAIISNPTSTSGTGAVQAIAPPAQFFSGGGGFVYSPSGSGAGQLSADNFATDIRNFPAGPSVLLIAKGGGYPVGLSVRRNGSTDLSGVVVCLW